jgi:hypothetical protein
MLQYMQKHQNNFNTMEWLNPQSQSYLSDMAAGTYDEKVGLS